MTGIRKKFSCDTTGGMIYLIAIPKKRSCLISRSGIRRGAEICEENLETILLRDPKYVLAYSEMARMAMKESWGPEGLGQVENYLNTGLQLDANNANVKVLLGYVCAHQKRYAEAEKILKKLKK